MIGIVIPLLVIAMLAYMFWLVAVPLRRDRIRAEREQTRGRHAFTRRERVRFLLGRAFHPRTDRPPWQEELQSSLDRVSGKSADKEREGS